MQHLSIELPKVWRKPTPDPVCRNWKRSNDKNVELKLYTWKLTKDGWELSWRFHRIYLKLCFQLHYWNFPLTGLRSNSPLASLGTLMIRWNWQTLVRKYYLRCFQWHYWSGWKVAVELCVGSSCWDNMAVDCSYCWDFAVVVEILFDFDIFRSK